MEQTGVGKRIPILKNRLGIWLGLGSKCRSLGAEFSTPTTEPNNSKLANSYPNSENVQKWTRYFLLFFRRVRATSMTQRADQRRVGDKFNIRYGQAIQMSSYKKKLYYINYIKIYLFQKISSNFYHNLRKTDILGSKLVDARLRANHRISEA